MLNKLNKMRDTLCRDWSFLLHVTTFGIALIGLVSLIPILMIDHPLFSVIGDYVGFSFLGFCTAWMVGIKLIIYLGRWQFLRAFGFDAPRKYQDVAQEKLQPLIDTAMIRLAAAQEVCYQRWEYIRTKRLKLVSTIEGTVRKEFLKQEENFVEAQFKKAKATYEKVANLGQVFNFTILLRQEYLRTMRKQDKKINMLEQQKLSTSATG